MNTHGGAREGAGRKTGKTHKKILISLPLAVAEWLSKQENKSKFISGLVEDKMKTVLDVINEFDADVKFEYVSDIFGTDNRMFDKAMIIDAIKDLSENVNLLDKHPAYGLEIAEDGAVCGWFVTDTDIIYANRFRHETVWKKLPV